MFTARRIQPRGEQLADQQVTFDPGGEMEMDGQKTLCLPFYGGGREPDLSNEDLDGLAGLGCDCAVPIGDNGCAPESEMPLIQGPSTGLHSRRKSKSAHENFEPLFAPTDRRL